MSGSDADPRGKQQMLAHLQEATDRLACVAMYSSVVRLITAKGMSIVTTYAEGYGFETRITKSGQPYVESDIIGRGHTCELAVNEALLAYCNREIAEREAQLRADMAARVELDENTSP